MAKVIIGGESYELAKYQIYELKRAAPYLDELTTFAALKLEGKPSDITSAIAPCLGIILPGMRKLLGDQLTIEELEKKTSLEEGLALQLVVPEILSEAGFQKAGEMMAALQAQSTATAPAASSNQSSSRSDASPPSSLPQDVQAVTGTP